MARALLRLAGSSARRRVDGLAAQHRVRELLVLVAELDALRAAVQPSSGGGGRRSGTSRPPAAGRGGRAGTARPCVRPLRAPPPAPRESPVARGRARLDERDRVRRLLPGARPPPRRRRARRGRTRRRPDRRGRAAGPDGPRPRSHRKELRAPPRSSPARPRRASAAQRRPRLDGCPGRRPVAGADVEQRPRRPPAARATWAEDRRGGVRGGRAVGEIGGDARTRARGADRAGVLPAVGGGEPFDLVRPIRPPRATSRSIRLRELRRERGQEQSAASTSSACVSGFTFRSSLATLPSASITKVERSTPM